jgi:hypothetical protein
VPSGQWFVRELRSSDTEDELHDRALMRLTPALERARYGLVAQDAQTLRYRRRYLPTTALLAGLLLTASAAYAIAHRAQAGGAIPWPAAAIGAAGIALLALVRRSEVVIITITARPGGSRALLAGYVNDRARIVLRTWSPPIRPNLRCITHPALRAPPAARSPAHSGPWRDR